MFSEWAEITLEALEETWSAILMFLPKLIGALLIFLVGWLFAAFVGKVVSEILKKLKIDRLFERTGWKEALEKAEIKVEVSKFLGEICKWILVIVFLMAAVETLGFYQFSRFLERVVRWLPNLVVAVVIFIVGVVVADILEKITKASAKKIGVSLANLLGGIVKGAIYVFTALAILLQLGIAQEIIRALVYGIVFGLSLALGLAFGLGGKDAAANLIEEFKKKISEK